MVLLQHTAMATVFEIRCATPDESQARQAARAAFDLVDRLEQELSRFIPQSDISRLNGSEAGRLVDLHEAAMDCLSYGKEIWEQTNGAFDVTIGPLQSTLRGPDGSPRKVSAAEIDEARSRCGCIVNA